MGGGWEEARVVEHATSEVWSVMSEVGELMSCLCEAKDVFCEGSECCAAWVDGRLICEWMELCDGMSVWRW